MVRRTRHAGGRAWKLVGEARGGGGYVSLNLYRTRSGALLRPCEMPAETVMDFVLGVQPETGD